MLSALAQKLFDSILHANSNHLFSNAYLKLLKKSRRLLIRLADPAVVYDLDGTSLLIPLSHKLPTYRNRYPQYSKNLARIAGQVLNKYSDMGIIDIGANIGDTVAILRSRTHCPILCIDGNDQFFAILQKNVDQLEDVYLEHAFVHTSTTEVSGQLVSEGGTARLIQTDASQSLQAYTLSEILAAHPDFPTPRLIKIDTDGLDPYIVQSEVDLLAVLKPVVFLEYDPFLFEQYGNNGFCLFENLRNAGYAHAVVYENTGEFLVSVDLADERLLNDINHFYSGRDGARYSDIAIFHEQDTDVFHAVRQAELAL